MKQNWMKIQIFEWIYNYWTENKLFNKCVIFEWKLNNLDEILNLLNEQIKVARSF